MQAFNYTQTAINGAKDAGYTHLVIKQVLDRKKVDRDTAELSRLMEEYHIAERINYNTDDEKYYNDRFDCDADLECIIGNDLLSNLDYNNSYPNVVWIFHYFEKAENITDVNGYVLDNDVLYTYNYKHEHSRSWYKKL